MRATETRICNFHEQRFQYGRGGNSRTIMYDPLNDDRHQEKLKIPRRRKLLREQEICKLSVLPEENPRKIFNKLALMQIERRAVCGFRSRFTFFFFFFLSLLSLLLLL